MTAKETDFLFLKFLALKKVNSLAPVAQKIADEVVFRRFQGEGVFFKIGPH